jgi:hypothetical protein
METWAAVFIVIAAIAIVLQTVLLFAFYFLFRQMGIALNQAVTSVDTKLSPVLSRVQLLLDESHEDLQDIVHETAEVARAVRVNSRRFDRLLEEAADRLRAQIIHVDRLLTGAIEAVEETGDELRKSLVEPVRTATAFVKGVRAGVDFFRGRSRIAERRREAEDEGLFV